MSLKVLISENSKIPFPRRDKKFKEDIMRHFFEFKDLSFLEKYSSRFLNIKKKEMSNSPNLEILSFCPPANYFSRTFGFIKNFGLNEALKIKTKLNKEIICCPNQKFMTKDWNFELPAVGKKIRILGRTSKVSKVDEITYVEKIKNQNLFAVYPRNGIFIANWFILNGD